MRKVSKTDFFGNPKVVSVNNDPSETIQSDAHLADIANILKTYGQQGGALLDEAELQFGDVSDFTDFHDVMINVRAAEVQFLKLPSKVREIFDHSVEIWLDTAHDKEKRDALVEAGFIKRKEAIVEADSPEAEKPGGRSTPEVAPGPGE